VRLSYHLEQAAEIMVLMSEEIFVKKGIGPQHLSRLRAEK